MKRLIIILCLFFCCCGQPSTSEYDFFDAHYKECQTLCIYIRAWVRECDGIPASVEECVEQNWYEGCEPYQCVEREEYIRQNYMLNQEEKCQHYPTTIDEYAFCE